MKEVERAGQYLAIVKARSPKSSDADVKIGLKQSTFDQLASTGQSTKCAQFYGLIQSGLMDAAHAFQGLNRRMMREGDMRADANVVAYSWRPDHDYVWSGNRFDGVPLQRSPPSGIVFVVLVRLFKEPDSVSGIVGCIEHWSWIAEDSELPFAPVNWGERYEIKCWSR